nr:MAG TPA: hypothetical protein [Myoviridae sp. ct5MF11]
MPKNCLKVRYSILLESWEQDACRGKYGSDWLEEVGESVRLYAMECEKSGKRPTFSGLIEYLRIMHNKAEGDIQND